MRLRVITEFQVGARRVRVVAQPPRRGRMDIVMFWQNWHPLLPGVLSPEEAAQYARYRDRVITDLVGSRSLRWTITHTPLLPQSRAS